MVRFVNASGIHSFDEISRLCSFSGKLLCDIHGDTVPLGDKIYAIRAPAPSSSPDILQSASRRTVGIVFNWQKQVGFNRAGDNARAFVFRPKVKGTYGSLEAAYSAAQEFINQPSLHEGPLLLTEPTQDQAQEQPFFSEFLRRLPITSKFVFASITLCLFLFVTYYSLMYLQENLGCSSKQLTRLPAALHPFCHQLQRLQLHVSSHIVEYIQIFTTQLQIAFVLVVKHIIDFAFR